MSNPFYIYVDVDDTFVRSFGTKRIPIPTVIEHVKKLFQEGAVLYCWSSGGAKYAKESAKEFGIENCLVDFLPKPNVSIDDLQFSNWSTLLQVHPNGCPDNTIASYKEKIIEQQTKT